MSVPPLIVLTLWEFANDPDLNVCTAYKKFLEFVDLFGDGRRADPFLNKFLELQVQRRVVWRGDHYIRRFALAIPTASRHVRTLARRGRGGGGCAERMRTFLRSFLCEADSYDHMGHILSRVSWVTTAHSSCAFSSRNCKTFGSETARKRMYRTTCTRQGASGVYMGPGGTDLSCAPCVFDTERHPVSLCQDARLVNSGEPRPYVRMYVYPALV